MKILIVEDEIDLLEAIAEGLRIDGYAIDTCSDGESAYELIAIETYDLILLDLNIPKLDGMELLKKVRQENQEIKILILSARDKIMDKVDGLDFGANDYLTKPFNFEELEARIRSLLRRNFVQKDYKLRCAPIVFDTKTRQVLVNNEEVLLTKKEKSVLEYLILNKGIVISQTELIEHVWDSSVNIFSNSIRVHMASLRKKLRNAIGYEMILNKVGEGYVIKERES